MVNPLRAVLEDPSDDGARLVCADWFEEHGESERAEFIRVQVRIAEMDEQGLGEWPEDGHTCFQLPCPVCHGIVEYGLLTSRLSDLWVSGTANHGLESIMPRWHCGMFRRGFLGLVELPCAVFLANAANIFATQPIEDVTITDIQLPVPRGAHTYTFRPDVNPSVTGYPVGAYLHPSIPFDSLSSACVKYGRKLAGLPRLTSGQRLR